MGGEVSFAGVAAALCESMSVDVNVCCISSVVGVVSSFAFLKSPFSRRSAVTPQ